MENPFGGIVKDKRLSLKNVKREAIPLSSSTLTLTSQSARPTSIFYDNDDADDTPPTQRKRSASSFVSFKGYSEYLGNKNKNT